MSPICAKKTMQPSSNPQKAVPIYTWSKYGQTSREHIWACTDVYFRYARSRHRFLDEETYAYRNLPTRLEHQNFAIESYGLAEAFRDRLSLHERVAGDYTAPSSSSDVRGRSRTRTSTAGAPLRSQSRSTGLGGLSSSSSYSGDVFSQVQRRPRSRSLSHSPPMQPLPASRE